MSSNTRQVICNNRVPGMLVCSFVETLAGNHLDKLAYSVAVGDRTALLAARKNRN